MAIDSFAIATIASVAVGGIGAVATTVATFIREKAQRRTRKEPVDAKATQDAQGFVSFKMQGSELTVTNASIYPINFRVIWKDASPHIELRTLARELSTVRLAMRQASSEPEEDLAVAEVAQAQIAAKEGDGPEALSHLAKAGQPALDSARSIGAEEAATAITVAMGL